MSPLRSTVAAVFRGLAAAIFAVGVAAAAPRDLDLEAAQRLRRQALAGNDAYAIVSSLTTEVGPRLAGTSGDAAAVAWAERTLRERGFSNVRQQEVIVPRWVRGSATLEVRSPFPAELPTLALGGSVGTSEDGLRAAALRVADMAALRMLPAGAATGKIVYIAGRTERTRDGSGYGRTVRARADGASVAASLGAVGLVIRSMSTSNNRLPHTGTLTYNIANPRIPAVAISNPDADALERQFDSGKPVELFLKVTARDLPQTRSANVIGEIPGTDPDSEIVLLGAHLDSWDPGVGALDDGAGVAVVIAAAQLIARIEPRNRRTIRVVLFANEEFGLSGATRYAGDETDSLARHAIAMECDLGAGPVWSLQSQVPPEVLPLVRKIQRVVAPLGVQPGGNDATGGADLGPLRTRGVPILAPQLDATYYFDAHHSANDTLDRIDPAHLRQTVAVYAVAAYLAARHAGSLGRLPTQSPPP